MSIPRGSTMHGKTVLITGATDGIGKASAEALARLGAAVVIVGREAARGQAARDEINSKTGSTSVEFMPADLSSQAETRRLAAAFAAQHPRLDVLIHNLGVMNAQRQETVDGIEATFAVNVLNGFLLTHRLLTLLKASAPARVIHLTSGAHRFAKLDFDDLQYERGYLGLSAYARSKVGAMLLAYEMARRLQGTGVTVNIADPGGADTRMTRGMTRAMMHPSVRWAYPLIPLSQRLSGTGTVERAAHSTVYLASSPDVEGVTGAHFDPRARRVPSSQATRDEAAARRLWDIAAALVGEKD